MQMWERLTKIPGSAFGTPCAFLVVGHGHAANLALDLDKLHHKTKRVVNSNLFVVLCVLFALLLLLLCGSKMRWRNIGMAR